MNGKGLQTLDELSDGHFQLLKVADDEYFLSSPAVSIESTFNTRTVCLTQLSKPIADFLGSPNATLGKFALIACRTSETESRNGVTYVNATPLIVVDHPSKGIVNFIYADPRIQKNIETLTEGYLADITPSSSSGNLAALAPSSGERTDPKREVAASGKGWSGNWRLIDTMQTTILSLDADGYSPDRKFRLRESSGVLLLRGPDDTWTFANESGGLYRGSSDSRGGLVTLERN